MNLLKYSNGWGHLIMSIVLISCGMLLILWPTTDAATKAIGISLILSASSVWLVTKAANEVAHNTPPGTDGANGGH